MIGSGYVGLATAACLADVVNNVMYLDVDESKTAMLTKGEIPMIGGLGRAQRAHDGGAPVPKL